MAELPRAGVAAGHPATARAGLEILEDGGSAADAAVAASLASCAAETIMTGLLGGGHAIYWDAAAGRARNLDFFVAVPGLGAPGREELWQAHGRLPWPRLVEPALRIARDGALLTPAHAAVLAMLAPVFRM